MTLKEYLSAVGMTHAEFAEKIGIHRSNVSRFCSGDRRPDLTTLQRIYEVTGGKVEANDFFAQPSDTEAA